MKTEHWHKEIQLLRRQARLPPPPQRLCRWTISGPQYCLRAHWFMTRTLRKYLCVSAEACCFGLSSASCQMKRWRIGRESQTRRLMLNLFRKRGCGLDHSITNRYHPSLSTPNINHLMYISGNGCSISRTDTLYADRTLSIPTGCRILRGVS